MGKYKFAIFLKKSTLSTFVLVLKKFCAWKTRKRNKEGNFFHGEKNLRRRWSINKIIFNYLLFVTSTESFYSNLINICVSNKASHTNPSVSRFCCLVYFSNDNEETYRIHNIFPVSDTTTTSEVKGNT